MITDQKLASHQLKNAIARLNCNYSALRTLNILVFILSLIFYIIIVIYITHHFMRDFEYVVLCGVFICSLLSLLLFHVVKIFLALGESQHCNLRLNEIEREEKLPEQNPAKT